MLKSEFKQRQKKWERFHDWERSAVRSFHLPDPLKVIGELSELCSLTAENKDSWRFTAGISRMRNMLRLIRSR